MGRKIFYKNSCLQEETVELGLTKIYYEHTSHSYQVLFLLMAAGNFALRQKKHALRSDLIGMLNAKNEVKGCVIARSRLCYSEIIGY